MRSRSLASVLALAASALAAQHAAAQPLTLVNVSAPQINCVFDTSCTVTVSDHTAPLFGSGFLQSRTYQAAPGSPAAGMWVYEYRIDLRNVVGITAIPYVTSLTLDLGAVAATLDYDGNGTAGEEVFVVTGGGLGSVAPVSAVRSGGAVTFTFTPPVAGGGSPGAGQSTYFFGVAAAGAPREVTATLTSNVEPTLSLSARAPRPSRMTGGAAMAAEDCVAYDPRRLRIEAEGMQWVLFAGAGARMMVLDNRMDAQAALTVARRHTAQCFVGRNNARSDRRAYILEYWTGRSGLPTGPVRGEDCIAYDPSALRVTSEGPDGWLLTDGRTRMHLLDNEADANRALEVARGATRHCFIGRGNLRARGREFVHEYWR